MYGVSKISSHKGAFSRRLVVFVKEPRPGAVKSRLAKNVGKIRAASWYRRQCRSTIRRVCVDPRWISYLAVSPDMEGMRSRVWPTNVERIPQGVGDLGDRMRAVLRSLPPGPIIIVGSDIPGITPSLLLKAFRTLERHFAVFGPSPDGGFWLVGLKRMRRPNRKLFRNVRWSSEHALMDCESSLLSCSVGLVDKLADVDTLEDIQSMPGVRI